MNVAMLLDMAAEGMGGRVAVSSNREHVTYAELRSRASRLARVLAQRDADTLACSQPCSTTTPIALFAAAWAGSSYAPLNYRLPEPARRILLERLGPATFELGGGAEATDGPTITGAADWPSYVTDPIHPAVVLYTSGTTSAPKAALLTHDNLLAYVLSTVEFAGAGDDEAALLAVPPFHIAGVSSILSNTYSGRRIVPLPRFSAPAWLDAVRDECITHAFVVPTMLARIVQAASAAGTTTVPTLRHLAYGGARMPLSVLEQAMELFPGADFVNGYGLTETSSTVCVLSPQDHRDAHQSGDEGVRSRLQSVGQPLPGIEVRVDGGEIQVRGPQVSGTYMEGTGLTEDGWLPTGDLGHIDGGGFVFITGRADDMIIAGGENLSPEEIEDALLRHPAVVAAAVVGVADDEWGERPAAMVVLSAPVDESQLMAWARDHLGGLKAPVAIEARDELPLTATGKVLRRQVRDELNR